MQPDKLTVRVYGILISGRNEVLLAEENINGRMVVKFPGGGLEIGESVVDCLKREFREETGLNIKIESHFYTSDFFIHSEINPRFQVIAVYYKVSCAETSMVDTGNEFDNIRLFWVPLDSLSENLVTFQSEKTVVRLLKEEKRNSTG